MDINKNKDPSYSSDLCASNNHFISSYCNVGEQEFPLENELGLDAYYPKTNNVYNSSSNIILSPYCVINGNSIFLLNPNTIPT